MSGGTAELEDRIVAAIRRIVRAIDLHSRWLLDRHGLTAPQLATLREASRRRGGSTSALARAVHLSQPTMSGVLARLERDGLVARSRSEEDRRSVRVHVTPDGEQLLAQAPSLLQDRFRARIHALEEWERLWLLAALQRIAAMMDAEELEADPVLETGPLVDADDPSATASGPSGTPGRGGRARSPGS